MEIILTEEQINKLYDDYEFIVKSKCRQSLDNLKQHVPEQYTEKYCDKFIKDLDIHVNDPRLKAGASRRGHDGPFRAR